jgi:hypothetical protein
LFFFSAVSVIGVELFLLPLSFNFIFFPVLIS